MAMPWARHSCVHLPVESEMSSRISSTSCSVRTDSMRPTRASEIDVTMVISHVSLLSLMSGTLKTGKPPATLAISFTVGVDAPMLRKTACSRMRQLRMETSEEGTILPILGVLGKKWTMHIEPNT